MHYCKRRWGWGWCGMMWWCWSVSRSLLVDGQARWCFNTITNSGDLSATEEAATTITKSKTRWNKRILTSSHDECCFRGLQELFGDGITRLLVGVDVEADETVVMWRLLVITRSCRKRKGSERRREYLTGLWWSGKKVVLILCASPVLKVMLPFRCRVVVRGNSSDSTVDFKRSMRRWFYLWSLLLISSFQGLMPCCSLMGIKRVLACFSTTWSFWTSSIL